MRTSRAAFLSTLLAAAGAAAPRAALADDKVRVGTAGLVSDAPLFIAAARGFYKEQNLEVEFTNLESGSKMIAPLGTGEIDAGAGAPSAALYNAVLRGINIRAVADKGRLSPGYGYNPLLVRKELMASGRVKTYRDLQGLKFASAATGAAGDSTLNEALKRGGIKFSDLHLTIIPFPSMIGAFANAAIDAAIVSEPIATQAIREGVAEMLASSDKFYPNQQIAVLFYGSKFIAERPEVAKRFMIAYVKALRYYHGALKGGRFAGPNAPSVISILQQYSVLKDPAIYAAMIPAGIDPNGYLNIASMNKDIDFWHGLNLIEGPIRAEQVVDMSFVENANKVLGRA
jgi:NitT/TauT family transport system substrate-binding protein